MNGSILDETQLTNEITGLRLLDAHRYWLNKRFLFNLLVGLAGLFSLIFFVPAFTVFDCFGILIWGVIANGLYSFGYVCESYMITKTKQYRDMKRLRKWLFWSGTILYMIVSFVTPPLSFLPVPL